MNKQKTNWPPAAYHVVIGLLLILALRVAATDAALVGKYYTNGIYPQISWVLAAATGWLPFSLGDALYASAVLLLLLKLVLLIVRISKRATARQELLHAFLVLMRWIVGTYLLFLLFWGLNYYRPRIFTKEEMRSAVYSTEDLASLSADLAKALNGAGRDASMYTFSLLSDGAVCARAVASFGAAGSRLPFYSPPWPSVKSPLFPAITNAMGVPGYYNPFTAEIQVNTTLPRFLLPFLITHEMAHQVGFAREEDADMVAYIACRSSQDNGFRYSAYFHMFNEANAELFLRDSVAALNNFNALDSMVKNDELLYSKLLSADAGMAHASGNLYNAFLQLNNEPHGSHSYHDLVPLLIAYRRRHGEL